MEIDRGRVHSKAVMNLSRTKSVYASQEIGLVVVRESTNSSETITVGP